MGYWAFTRAQHKVRGQQLRTTLIFPSSASLLGLATSLTPILHPKSAAYPYTPKLTSVVEIDKEFQFRSQEAWHGGKTLTLD